MRTFYTSDEIWLLPWLKNPTRPRTMQGVYVVTIKDTGTVVYVGQSKQLHSRLCPAVHPVYEKKLHDIYILVENDPNERAYMEMRFIEILKPTANIRRGISPRMTEEVKREYYRRVFD